uniref:Amino acid transporter transmembrane domain-containing protein n=1 Tax=Alexandrium monilatum TaxID=311494 RepID=A0A7S4PU24_9DINO|mmetsp:Transcript_45309/g.142110  ORF Transcript_45309/g.142110 Transcript_45309/m.142110 type:complete len:219 (+) Transcript_45309:671-1327(+)
MAEPAVRWESVPVAMGLAVFCNEGMVVLTPSVHAVMCFPKRFPRAVIAMTVYFTANYLLIGVAGDFLFSYLRDAVVASEVTLSFHLTLVHRVAVCLYIFQLLLSFPLVTFTVFASIEQSWLPDAPLTARRVLRAVLVLSAGAVAVLVPRFGDFIAAAGGLANSLGIYILPNLAILKAASLGELQLSAPRRLACWLITGVFGVAAGALATGVSVKHLFS